MASTVSQLYDYKQADIPEELTRWHVTEEEVQAALTVLSQEHAALARADRAEDGDAVQCVCLTAPQEGRTVLVYPGRKLPGAEEAERAVLGRRAGDRFSCGLVSSTVTLEVREVLRLTPHPVDDELARLAGIDGVSTLAEYRARFIRETEPQKREAAAKKVTNYLWDMLGQCSQVSLDQEEQGRWCLARGKSFYNSRIKHGPDPHIPEEGTVLLSDEEALAKLVREQEPEYRKFVIIRHTVQQNGFTYTEELFRKDVGDFLTNFRERLEKDGYDFANAYSESEFLLWEAEAYERRLFELLRQAAESYLEV